MVLGAGYLGLQYIPGGWLVPYERVLTVVCPLFILAEGLAAMTVILSSGQLWSETLSEQPTSIKVPPIAPEGMDRWMNEHVV